MFSSLSAPFDFQDLDSGQKFFETRAQLKRTSQHNHTNREKGKTWFKGKERKKKKRITKTISGLLKFFIFFYLIPHYGCRVKLSHTQRQKCGATWKSINFFLIENTLGEYFNPILLISSRYGVTNWQLSLCRIHDTEWNFFSF